IGAGGRSRRRERAVGGALAAVPARQPGAADHSARDAVREAEDGTGEPGGRVARRAGESRRELQAVRRADQPDDLDAEKERRQGSSLRPGVDTVLAQARHDRPGPRPPLSSGFFDRKRASARPPLESCRKLQKETWYEGTHPRDSQDVSAVGENER